MLTERDFKRIVEILNDGNQAANLIAFFEPECDNDAVDALLDDFEKLLNKYGDIDPISMLTCLLLIHGEVRGYAYAILAHLYESLKQKPKALLEFDEMLREELPDDDFDDDFEDFEDDAPAGNVVQFPGSKKK